MQAVNNYYNTVLGLIEGHAFVHQSCTSWASLTRTVPYAGVPERPLGCGRDTLDVPQYAGVARCAPSTKTAWSNPPRRDALQRAYPGPLATQQIEVTMHLASTFAHARDNVSA